jgi:hypothetical protein
MQSFTTYNSLCGKTYIITHAFPRIKLLLRFCGPKTYLWRIFLVNNLSLRSSNLLFFDRPVSSGWKHDQNLPIIQGAERAVSIDQPFLFVAAALI